MGPGVPGARLMCGPNFLSLLFSASDDTVSDGCHAPKAQSVGAASSLTLDK